MNIKVLIYPIHTDDDQVRGFVTHENAEEIFSQLSHEVCTFFYEEGNIIGHAIYIRDSNLALMAFQEAYEIFPLTKLRKEIKRAIKAGTHTLVDSEKVVVEGNEFAYCDTSGMNLAIGLTSEKGDPEIGDTAAGIIIDLIHKVKKGA